MFVKISLISQEICEVFKNNFFYRTSLVAASVNIKKNTTSTIITGWLQILHPWGAHFQGQFFSKSVLWLIISALEFSLTSIFAEPSDTQKVCIYSLVQKSFTHSLLDVYNSCTNTIITKNCLYQLLGTSVLYPQFFLHASLWIFPSVHLDDYLFQKQPSRDVPRKRCSENIQQIYRRTPMPKCDFNKVAKQLYWNHTSS